jgi:hypothetical protein
LFLEFRTDEPGQKQGTSPSVTIGWGRHDSNTIVFDISGTHAGFHQDSRVGRQWGPIPWSEGESGGNLFASVEPVRDNLAGMKRRVSFGPIAEDEALEQDDLENGANDKRDVNEDGRGRSPADVGGWKDESGEDDPEADGGEEQGSLGD